jgi:hypothetical protein
MPSIVYHHAPTTIPAGTAQGKPIPDGKQQAAMIKLTATRKGNMAKRKSIKLAHARRSKQGAPRNLIRIFDRTSDICRERNKADIPTNTRPRRRKPTAASKTNGTPATLEQTTLPDLDRCLETPEEQQAWDKLARDLAEDVRKFNPEESVKQLRFLSIMYGAAKIKERKRKYKALQHVYQQYVLAKIGGKLPELMDIYRKQGLKVHNDAHPVLAVIRARITTNRDCVTRWGSALRLAQTKEVLPEKLTEFLQKHGIERSCKEFRKLQAQARLAVVEDGRVRAETSVDEMDAEMDKTSKTIERSQPVKSGKEVTGKAGDQTPIETTTDFNESFMRITRNRKDVFVNIDGHFSADGRLSLQTVRIADGSATRKQRPKTQ